MTSTYPASSAASALRRLPSRFGERPTMVMLVLTIGIAAPASGTCPPGHRVSRSAGSYGDNVRLRDRDVLRIAMAPLLPRHWAALARMFTTYQQPGAALRRYLGNTGAYQWQPVLRTPLGDVRPALSNYHDLLTVNEVFCRRDYGSGKGVEVVVDIGANIGLAALFFLTRNSSSRAYCFEPDPANAAALRSTLTGYEDRYTLSN